MSMQPESTTVHTEPDPWCYECVCKVQANILMDPCDFLTHLTRFVKIIPLETCSIQHTVIGKQREAALTPSVSTPRLQCVKKEKC